MKRQLTLLLVVLPTLSHAEPTYVGAAVTVSGDELFNTGIGIEAGRQLGGHPGVFLRAMIQGGASEPYFTEREIDGNGTYLQARIGGELRTCRGIACGGLALDLGYHHSTFTTAVDAFGMRMSETHDNVIVVPRLSADVGGELRLRGALELPYHAGDSLGVGVSLGLVRQF